MRSKTCWPNLETKRPCMPQPAPRCFRTPRRSSEQKETWERMPFLSVRPSNERLVNWKDSLSKLLKASSKMLMLIQVWTNSCMHTSTKLVTKTRNLIVFRAKMTSCKNLFRKQSKILKSVRKNLNLNRSNRVTFKVWLTSKLRESLSFKNLKFRRTLKSRSFKRSS